MANISASQLLLEIEDVLRTMPPRATIRHEAPENLSWLGRASAVVAAWNSLKSPVFERYITKIHAVMALDAEQGLRGAVTMLHQARHDLRLQTTGPLTVAIDGGSVFDYFNEVRQIVDEAKLDLFFIDPYLDAEFVSRYLTHAAVGISVRLLAREKISTLLPAVTALRLQAGLTIDVRSAPSFHDRYVIVGRQECFQSGASFKNGARNAPTTLTQITDAFAAVATTYEQMWSNAKVHA